jgi:predicted PurR-regulated permease PerM
MSAPGRERFERAFLLILVAGITLLFAAMVRRFLVTLFLAAIFSALVHPLYARILAGFRGRKGAASLATLGILVVVIVVPLLGLLAVVAREAIQVSEQVRPAVSRWIQEPGSLAALLERVPGIDRLTPYRAQVLAKAGEAVQALGGFLVQSLSATTRGTLSFFFHVFLLLYSMFYFLMDGERVLRLAMHYLPLADRDEEQMLGRFVSVTRATLKGTLIIGAIQGTLAGSAFAVAGIGGAVFWGAVMTFLSILPGIGSGLIWVPASAILVLGGRPVAGILLAVFCGGVVGSVDNFLRPRLVGKDAKLHGLLIFLGTIGGIFLFGIFGFVIGPIVAALFVTVWELYGAAFRGFLPGREAETGFGDGGFPPPGGESPLPGPGSAEG